MISAVDKRRFGARYVFTPSLRGVADIETLRAVADLLWKQCGLEEPYEGDSIHYLENTYYEWVVDGCEAKLYLSETRGQLELFVLSEDVDVTAVAKRLETILVTMSDGLQAEFFEE